ncbi:unnamed protein product [Caenorhabditis brenneri]
MALVRVCTAPPSQLLISLVNRQVVTNEIGPERPLVVFSSCNKIYDYISRNSYSRLLDQGIAVKFSRQRKLCLLATAF